MGPERRRKTLLGLAGGHSRGPMDLGGMRRWFGWRVNLVVVTEAWACTARSDWITASRSARFIWDALLYCALSICALENLYYERSFTAL